MFRVASLIAVVAGLALAPAAYAQDSSFDAYSGERGEAVGATNGGGDPTDPGATPTSQSSSSDSSGVLPFTGMDVGFLLGGGLVLIAVGAGLARLRTHSPAA
ncbi:MAG: hypothetical protein ACRDL3_06290 [Solirubrobacterales bacterium]